MLTRLTSRSLLMEQSPPIHATRPGRLTVSLWGFDGGIVHEQDCFHHLHSVWTNGVAKAVSEYMKDSLHDILDNISSFPRTT